MTSRRSPTQLGSPPWLSIETSVSADRHLASVWVDGELDRDSAGELLQVFRTALTDTGPQTIEVDLSAVTFIDAAGIRSLVTCRQLAEETGGTLHLKNPRPQARFVLGIAELSEVFGLPATPGEKGGSRRR
ncbi:STAS domain-containing protein [Catenuloplanes sp. NPDC051500]|uniref:STAS domain-containing protein n=1 Tax=Catenuloplanes sp. NPDC051500 TaxID=3363959 RepID=UPI0037A6554D